MSIRTRITLGEPHPHLGPLISSYQDNCTTPEETRIVEQHLRECEGCQNFYAGLQQMRGVITELPGQLPDLEQMREEFRRINARAIYPAELKKAVQKRSKISDYLGQDAADADSAAADSEPKASTKPKRRN